MLGILLGLNNHFVRGSRHYPHTSTWKGLTLKNKAISIVNNDIASALLAGVFITWFLGTSIVYLLPLSIVIGLSEALGRGNSIFTGTDQGPKNKIIDKATNWVFSKLHGFNKRKDMAAKWWKIYGAYWQGFYGLLTAPLFAVLALALSNPVIALYGLLCPFIRVFSYGVVNLFYPGIQYRHNKWQEGKRKKQPWDFSLALAECLNWYIIGEVIWRSV